MYIQFIECDKEINEVTEESSPLRFPFFFVLLVWLYGALTILLVVMYQRHLILALNLRIDRKPCCQPDIEPIIHPDLHSGNFLNLISSTEQVFQVWYVIEHSFSFHSGQVTWLQVNKSFKRTKTQTSNFYKKYIMSYV